MKKLILILILLFCGCSSYIKGKVIETNTMNYTIPRGARTVDFEYHYYVKFDDGREMRFLNQPRIPVYKNKTYVFWYKNNKLTCVRR